MRGLLAALGIVVLLSGCERERSVTVEACAAGFERVDAIAEFRVDLAEGERVAAVREAGAEVRFQSDEDYGSAQVTARLSGAMTADACRLLNVTIAPEDEATEARDPVERIAEYQGEAAFRIATEAATYVYHMGGSGFASLIDRDGNDWISYRPEGGFEGNYRGIPNIAPPQFHPGRPEGKRSSEIMHHGPLKTTIESGTKDGQWRLRWEIFPRHARMTLLSKGPEPYWILYEGTPGGEFDPEVDYWLNSAGEIMPMEEPNEFWNAKLPDPQWVMFVDREVGRGLFLALHEPDNHWDEFWHRGAGGMTVFGFGRGPKPQWQYLDAAPAQLTIGLIEETAFPEARRQIESAWRPLQVTVR